MKQPKFSKFLSLACEEAGGEGREQKQFALDPNVAFYTSLMFLAGCSIENVK